MQRQRIALVLDDDAGSQRRDAGQPLPELGGKRRGAPGDRSFLLGRAQFGAMAADRRQPQRGEDAIDVLQRAAAHQRKCLATEPVEPRQIFPQVIGDTHLIRRRSDVEDRPIDVEQERELGRRGGKARHDVRHGKIAGSG